MNLNPFTATPAANRLSSMGLPIFSLSAAELVERKYVQTSVSLIYEADRRCQLYHIKAADFPHRYEYPVWQFCKQSPQLLPKILPTLICKLGSRTETFLLTSFEQIADLSPAELIAGWPFQDSDFLECQIEILNLEPDERIGKLLQLADDPALKVDVNSPRGIWRSSDWGWMTDLQN